MLMTHPDLFCNQTFSRTLTLSRRAVQMEFRPGPKLMTVSCSVQLLWLAEEFKLIFGSVHDLTVSSLYSRCGRAKVVFEERRCRVQKFSCSSKRLRSKKKSTGVT